MRAFQKLMRSLGLLRAAADADRRDEEALLAARAEARRVGEIAEAAERRAAELRRASREAARRERELLDALDREREP